MRYGSTTPTGTNPVRSGMNMGKGFRELRSSGQTGYLYSLKQPQVPGTPSHTGDGINPGLNPLRRFELTNHEL